MQLAAPMRLCVLLASLAAACDDTGSPSPPDMSRPCDPVAQSCAAPAKCSITGYTQDGALTECLVAGGAKAEDDLCARDRSIPDAGLGHDDCARGHLCSALGGLGTTESTHLYRCWKYCSSDSACDPGKKCITLNESPPIGVCVPTCTPFGACPQSFNCSFILPDVNQVSAHLGCREPGTVPGGAVCGDGTQCAADHLCNPFGNPKTCLPLCDATHPCASGSCIAVPGIDATVCL